MAVPPLAKWTFEYKITMGNVLMLVCMLGTATVGYIDLRYKVQQLWDMAQAIPQLEDRMAASEARGVVARADREELNLKVDELDKTLNLILQSNARIEERVGNLQEQVRRNGN